MLDKLLTGALQGLGGGQTATDPMVQLVTSLLSNNGPFGGLGGLIQAFRQAGLGAQIDSWISTGANMPVAPEQLAQVFGAGRMQQMAQQTGLDTGQLGAGLSQLLPQLIDQLTPQGQAPAGGLDAALAALSRMAR